MSAMSQQFWKEEPASPLSYYDEATATLAQEDATFYQTALEQFANDVKLEGDELLLDETSCESKAEVATHILENLESLMDLDDLIKEEPFLLDEKLMAGAFLPSPPHVHIIQDLKSDQDYLQTDFGAFIYGSPLPPNTLTPPQSPPQQHFADLKPPQQQQFADLKPPQQQHFADLKPVQQQHFADLKPVQQQQQPLTHDLSDIYQVQVIVPEDDIAQELAVVDELVRSRVEDMQWSGSSNPASPGDSSSYGGDCSSSSEDPEWLPTTDLNQSDDSPLIKTTGSNRKRRSYQKGPPEEKKVRKKEQNKNAATRYRLKKKAEVEVILTEEKVMLDHNQELKVEVTDLEREVKYLKGLMRDLFKAKGLIE